MTADDRDLHAHKCKSHTITRFRERHGLDVVDEDVSRMVDQVTSGSAMRLKRVSAGCELYAVKHGARWYQVVYDPEISMLRTVYS